MPSTLKHKLPPPVLALSIGDSAKAAGIGRDGIYQLIKSGVIKPRKFGTRSLIILRELEEALDQLPVGGVDHA